MSFLKDFRDELSQAVNELVNIDENENEDTDAGSNRKKEDSKDMARQKKAKNSEENKKMNTETADEGITVKEENVNTIDNQEEDNGIDMQMLNELFGSEEKNPESEILSADEVLTTEQEKELNDDFDLDNIDMSDYLSDDKEEKEDMSVEEGINLKDITEDIKSTLEGGMSEEKSVNEKEQTKAALRGERWDYQENNRDSYTDRADEESALATEDIAEITKGTMVEGNIVSEGSINVYGKIKGNVACRGKMVVCGTIVGSSRAAEVFTNNAKINGDITSDGSLKIGNGSVIIGNIYGSSAVIAGAVQGDVDIHGPVVIDGTAVIQGNIRSRSVQINNGAAIEGMISQCYAEIDYAALFDKTFSN